MDPKDGNQNNPNDQGNQGTDGNQGNQNNQGNQGNQGNQNNEGKTYTQAEINAMMANEKRTARNALLKELGFDVKDDKSFKDTVSGIKKTLDAGKSQQQLDKEAKEAAEQAKGEAESKAAHLELQVAALKFGVKSEYLDDIIALATPQISETKPMDKVMEELKKRYPTSFGDSGSGNSGTGSGVNPANKPGSSGSKGQELAKAHKNAPAKSSYFKNN